MSNLSLLAAKGAELKKNNGSILNTENNSTSVLSKIVAGEKTDNMIDEEERAKNQGGFFGGIGYFFEKIGLGFLSGIEGIWDYAAGGLAKLFGADEWAEQQFANDWVNYNHADEWFNPSEGWKVAGDVAGGIGTSLPAIAGVAAAGAIAYFSGGSLTPVAAGLISASVAGLGAAGRATKEAYDQTGELTGKEFGYGALVGVTEGAIEGISAGIGVGTGQVVKNVAKSFGKEVAETATRQTLGKAVVKGFIGEAFEEGIAELITPTWKRLTYDPNAKNATFQEVGYAALIGGLSGALMGGFDVSVRNVASTARGNTINTEGKANDVIGMAEQISQFETENNTGYESFEIVKSTLAELQSSLQKTNGQVTTVKQKMLLGVLEKANTASAFTPFIAKSAENIVNNAEVIAKRLTDYGYTDANGKAITFTAEQIRSGVDINNPKTFMTSLKTNSILRTLAVADATGRLSIDTAKFKQAALMGQQLSSQVDLNRFIETATDSELKAVGERLGIDNWQGITREEFNNKVVEFVNNGGVETYRQERLIVKDIQNIDPTTSLTIPKLINQQDGTVRYSKNGVDIAIVKNGDSYRIYDYESGRLTKTLTKSEVNKLLKEINSQQSQAAQEVTQQLERAEQESELKRQAGEIDSYARENIKDYSKLNAANQLMVRAIIRQGRAAGVSEDVVLSCARISSRSGLNVVFSKELSFVAADGSYADGAIDLKNNRIIINPEAKTRTTEQILIHELTHAIYNSKDGVLTAAAGLKSMTAEEKSKIRERYSKIGKGGTVEVSDEINAHFAENTLSNKNILERLIKDKPTVKEKILNFFKRAKTDYQEDAKLTGAAAKLYKQYKKLFDSFAAQNQQTNANELLEQSSQSAAYALANNDKNDYNSQKGVENGQQNETNKERNNLGNVQGQQRADKISSLRDFSKNSQKARLETAADRLEYLKILKEGGYTQVKIDNIGVNNFISYIEVKEDALLPVLKEIRAENKALGFKTKFTTSGFNISGDNINYDNALGLYAPSYDTIYIRLFADEDITLTNNHERLHNVERKYPDLFNAFRTEVKQVFGNEYNKAVESVAEDWGLADFRLKEKEFLSEFFAGGQRIDFGLDIDAQRDVIIEKYRKLLAQKGGLDNLRYALPETDSTGKALTTEQRQFFSESKVVDDKGRLLEVYHGTKDGSFNVFKIELASNTNMLGLGFYFANTPTEATRYAGKKGRVINAYLNIKNPLYVELAHKTALINALENIYGQKFANGETETMFDVRYYLQDSHYKDRINTKKLLDLVKKEGFDGIICKPKGYFVAFNSEQIKKVSNKTPTDSADIRYALSDTDSEGKTLSTEQKQFFAESKIIDKNGQLKVLYHGSRSNFTVFNRGEGGKSNNMANVGFWFTESSQGASNFANSVWYGEENKPVVYGVYLNLKNPKIYTRLQVDEQYEENLRTSLKEAQQVEADIANKYQLIKVGFRLNVQFARLLDMRTDFDELVADFREDMSGENIDIDAVIDDAKRARNAILKQASIEDEIAEKLTYTDGYEQYRADIYRLAGFNSEYANSGGVGRAMYRDGQYLDKSIYVEQFRENLIKQGYDGIEIRETYYDTGTLGENNNQYVAFYPEQIKLTTNTKPTADEDIRYALPFDNEGNALTDEQLRYFKDSKIRDEQGRLITVYHGTDKSFYTFKNKGSQNGRSQGDGFYFAAAKTMAEEYGGRVVRAYLNIKNPFFLHDKRTIEQELKHRGYNLQELAAKYGIELNEFDSLNWGKDEKTLLTKMGYDGVVSVWSDENVISTAADDRSIIVAYKSNQIKEVSNTRPTKDPDIRYALESEEDGGVVGGLTKAQRAKFVANNTKLKVYSKADAERIINTIISDRLNIDERFAATLSAKNKNQLIDYLFKELNGASEGYRGNVALHIADFIMQNAVIEDMWQDTEVGDVEFDKAVVSYMNSLRHKFDLSGIKSEINYKFDKKNSIFLQWGASRDGLAPDSIAQEFQAMGFHNFTAINEADQFFEMLEVYNAANARLNTKIEKQMLSTYGDSTKLEQLRQQIARDILVSYDTTGETSKYGKLVEKYTKKIAALVQQNKELKAINRLTNSIIDKAQKLRDSKLGNYLNATQYNADVFTKSISRLANIKFRGNYNQAGTRRIIAEFSQWYNKDNPMLAGCFEQDIADMLNELSSGSKALSKDELTSLNNVLAYFNKFVENYNKVYRQGKWVEALPEAERYIDIIHNNENIKSGLFVRLAGTSYFQTFADPMSVARRMDKYESGFYTEMLSELREAAVDSEIAEMEVKTKYDEFLSKNKKYLANITNTTVEYQGVQVPKSHLIGVYMSLKRKQAQKGLALNGFAFLDKDGKRIRVKGFAENVVFEEVLQERIAQEQSKLESLMSETDKEYISILETAYNQDVKELKVKRDMERLGFTNAKEDYYYPIKRGNIARNVDTSDFSHELDRVSSASFNKDTVQGAAQELYIESADVVFNRHVKAVCKYSYLSPAIDTYNRLYNIDITENRNKPVSVATESANTWNKGNNYFSKLISDIQGISPTSSEGMKALSFIRGSYAKFQLGANPKVWVTQLSSMFASSSILDADSIARGATISAKDVDTYCKLAKLRNSNNTVAMAQGVINKIGKVSDVLMAPIGKMDRFVVCRLFGACQAQVEKTQGLKVGTVENKTEAGKLLKRVILETQQNSIATERSAAMRSGNELLKTVTMFTADSMKVVGRVIDSIGELTTLKAKLKATTDVKLQETLRKQIKAATKKVRKSVTAMLTSAAFMACVAQLFKWLYNKDQDEDEIVAETMLVDFVGNLFGGLPLIKDVYARLAEGYDFDNYAYSTINNMLDSAIDIFDATGKIVSGNATQQDIASSLKKLSYSAGQLFGIPTRNIYNVAYGLTKRVSPTTAYKIDNVFYKKNYLSDLKKAIEDDDVAMVTMLTGMLLNQRVGTSNISDALNTKLHTLYSKGYTVLPKNVGDTISINGETYSLTEEDKAKFKKVYSLGINAAEKLITNTDFMGLSEEKQAKTIKQIFDAYYSRAITELTGVKDNSKFVEMSNYIDIAKLAVVYSGLSDITSDKDSKGNTITGSKKANIIKYLLTQNLTDEQRLFILAYQGYSIQDGDYKRYSAKQAKSKLLRFIMGLKSASKAEKSYLAEICGFEVRSGVIVKQSLYNSK